MKKLAGKILQEISKRHRECTAQCPPTMHNAFGSPYMGRNYVGLLIISPCHFCFCEGYEGGREEK